MAWYAFQELTLEMTHAGPACGEDVERLLQPFTFRVSVFGAIIP
jgi:hypothetical protein